MIATIRDVLSILWARPGRLASQSIGMALGAALFVVALGLGQSLSAQVDERFDAIRATTVSVDQGLNSERNVQNLDDFVTSERIDSALRIPGLAKISRMGIIREQSISATPTAVVPPTSEISATIMVADPSLLETVEAKVRGYGLNPVDAQVNREITVIGRGLAASLEIDRPGMLIRYGSSFFEVIGILEDTKRSPDLLGAMVVSEKAIQAARPNVSFKPRIIIQTTPGAAGAVSTNLAMQLRPDDPMALAVTAPPSPESLHRSVSQDVQLLSLLAAFAVLLAGVFAVTNLMILSISQRIHEIGMRRAMGASKLQILSMILIEAIIVGAISGAVGTIAGLWGVLGICISNHWAPVISLDIIWIGIAAGIIGGAIGGSVPAIIAARIQPADALRY